MTPQSPQDATVANLGERVPSSRFAELRSAPRDLPRYSARSYGGRMEAINPRALIDFARVRSWPEITECRHVHSRR